MAKMDAGLIMSGRPVKHWLNGLIHITVAIIAAFWFNWLIGVAVLLECRLMFDSALNTFRHYNIGYVPAKPASIIDQIEKKIFGKNGILPKIIYLTVAIILNFI
jgi:hypothetical protein